MASITDLPVQQALERIRDLSADAETRRLAFVRERALRDEISELRAERKRGKIEGRIEGEAAMLERQIAKRFGPLSNEIRARIKSANADQLERWSERILDAPTSADVFNDH